jgi:hypothetical protein
VQKVRSHQFHNLPSSTIQFWVDDYSSVSSASLTTSTFKPQVVALNALSAKQSLEPDDSHHEPRQYFGMPGLPYLTLTDSLFLDDSYLAEIVRSLSLTPLHPLSQPMIIVYLGADSNGLDIAQKENANE